LIGSNGNDQVADCQFEEKKQPKIQRSVAIPEQKFVFQEDGRASNVSIVSTDIPGKYKTNELIK